MFCMKTHYNTQNRKLFLQIIKRIIFYITYNFFKSITFLETSQNFDLNILLVSNKAYIQKTS
jgi:hypothetical protein